MKKVTPLLLAVVLALPACESNVRDFSPTLINNGIQLQQNKVSVEGQHANVIMKASGSTFPVEFSTRLATDPDQRMIVQGTVVDSGRGKVFGWIAKVNETVHSATLKHFSQLEVQADADQPFEVSGYASGSSINSGYRCGPIRSTFTPERSKVYLVEFQFIADRCQQHVYDVTQPQERIPVASVSGL